MTRRHVALMAAFVAALSLQGVAAAHPSQHGDPSGHLVGEGAWGDIDLVQTVRVDSTRGLSTTDLIADVGVSPNGNWAFLANWGEATCAANSEAGGVTQPDAGVWVIDLRGVDDADPATSAEVVGFIPHSQDSRPGEGVQVVDISTRFFSGTVLVTNNEQCGKNGKGGVSLFDVTDPTKPFKLSEHFGDPGFADTNDIHSAWAWDAGSKAYVVIVDNFETTDVDVLDITNPKRPRLIADINLNTLAQIQLGRRIDQQALGLQESSLHDMIVKEIGGRFIMLLSYWDGGYVAVDVTSPTSPQVLDDTDFTDPDPELLEQSGISLPPEGNGHQAEYTSDNRFFIGADEDFSPYRPQFRITTGANAGSYAAGEFGWTKPIVSLLDQNLNGPTVYGGYGCPDDAAEVPDPSVLGPLDPGEEAIVVFQRGPVGDPSHPHDACFFSDKVRMGEEKGYGGVIIANHHVGAQAGETPDAFFCGGQGSPVLGTAPAICIGHRAFHLLLDSEPVYDVPYVAGTEPAIGTIGADVGAPAEFDGWGYLHLFDASTMEELDTFAIPEAMDPDFAFGFGTMSVHEIATHRTAWDQAYSSYYEGGLRSFEIRCTGRKSLSRCDLVESGGYLDPEGNDFWGVETFIGDDGKTYVLGSDRDSGLWIFEDTSP